MRVFNIIPFLFLMCSCIQNRPESNKMQILGEWYPLDAENMEGYHFKESNLCENKLGYYNCYFVPESRWPGQSVFIDEKDNSFQINFDERSIINYQGNTTFYEVNKDSLRIFNLSKKTLVNWQIKFPAKDTLLLSSNNDSVVHKYVHKNYPIDTIPLFDEIVFFSKGNPTYGLCDKYISINRNGELITFLSGSGFMRLKMHLNEFDCIERSFKKAGMKNLIDSYDRQYMEDPDFVFSNITFIKDNHIIFSCDNATTQINRKEFLWAYLSAFFYQSYNQLELLQSSNLYANDFPEIFSQSVGFYADNRRLFLHASESFYLRNILNKAKETNQNFTPVYVLRNAVVLKIRYNQTPKFETDGRFFRYQRADGKKITLDIGFNFIEENQLGNQFKDNPH